MEKVAGFVFLALGVFFILKYVFPVAGAIASFIIGMLKTLAELFSL